jgi:hypothetical protein
MIPIKTASETGYCDCICGCYELASLRDEDTGKGYCPACAKNHVDLNAGVGIPQPAPAKVSPNPAGNHASAGMPSPADPPGRVRGVRLMVSRTDESAVPPCTARNCNSL